MKIGSIHFVTYDKCKDSMAFYLYTRNDGLKSSIMKKCNETSLITMGDWNTDFFFENAIQITDIISYASMTRISKLLIYVNINLCDSYSHTGLNIHCMKLYYLYTMY